MTVATDPQQPPVSGQPPVTMLNPDFPFSYDLYLDHPAGLGSVPPELYGTEVAVVGAGLSGLVTAYELMKLGLRPVLYEADQLGGRLRTASFPAAPDVVADLGGMRFPVSGRAFYHYVDKLGLATAAFPNPLAEATSSTVIELAGTSHYARTSRDLPEFFHEVAAAWKAAVNDGAQFTEMQEAIRARDTARIKELWNALLPELDEETFYGFIAGASLSRRPASPTARPSDRWGSAPAAGTPTSRTPSWRSCGWSTRMPTTGTARSSAARSGCPRHSGTTRRRAWRTGRKAPPWPRCTVAPRAARWPGSPANGRRDDPRPGALGPRPPATPRW